MGDGGDGAALGEFAQQPEAAYIHVARLHPQCSLFRLCYIVDTAAHWTMFEFIPLLAISQSRSSPRSS